MNSDTPRRLGRGLEALINTAQRPVTNPNIQRIEAPASPASSQTPAASSNRIPISAIKPNPFQPRREFNAEELKELEDSLRATGLLQPITVRPAPSGPGFELAAGERRLRAATRLGWTDIPATVRDLSDRELLAVALVENLQRADLNPIEEAEGYSRLITEFNQTQQAVADMVGKDRSTIANMLRLLNLPGQVRSMVQNSALTLGHARSLLGLGDSTEIVALANEIVARGLSVRDVEKRVRDRKPTPKPMSENRTAPVGPLTANGPHIKQIEDQLRRKLQTDAKISLSSTDKGTISISFYSTDDLERLLDIILGTSRELY